MTYIFFLLFVSLTMLWSSEAIHVCNLIKSTVLSMSLSTPTTGSYQKYFLIIANNFCELEATYDRSEQRHFGIKFGFKNKQCQRADWLFPKTYKRSHFQCGFGLRSGEEEWTQNKVGFVSVWAKKIQYSLFPIDTDDLTLTQELRTIDFDMKGFVPTFAYNVFSRQDLNTIIFFEQRLDNSNRYKLRAEVFNFEDDKYYNYTELALQELEEYESPNISPRLHGINKRQWNRINSRYIPKAVMKTDRSMRIVGLYGLRLPWGRADPLSPNGTIILFKKMGPNGFQTYWYCVTDEYELSQDCKSPESYQLLIDCDNEVVPDEPDDGSDDDETQLTSTEVARYQSPDEEMGRKRDEPNTQSQSSAKLFYIVISILAIIVVVLVFISVIFSSDPWADEYYKNLKRNRPKGTPKPERNGIDRRRSNYQ